MLRLAAALAIVLPAPALGAAQRRVDPVVDITVAGAQRLVGQQLGQSVRVTRVRGEGRAMVIEVAIDAGASRMIGPAQIVGPLVAGMCSEPGAEHYFTEGRTVRVQATRGGRPAGAATIDRCPPSAGRGITAQTFADGMQAFVGQGEGGIRISEIRAEGNVMIVTLALPAGTPDDVESLGASFLEGFCRRPDAGTGFFGNGLVLRVDIAIGRAAPRRSPRYTACPAR